MQPVNKTDFVLKYRACNQKIFNAGEILWNWGTSINISSKTHTKKGSQGKIEQFFFLDTVKNYISNKKFNQKMDTIRPFFPKVRELSSIFKMGQGRPPPPTPPIISFMLF